MGEPVKLTQAAETDNEEIKNFYNPQVIQGIFNYRIERPDSFFDQYRLYSDNFKTYLLRDDDGSIQAMASVVFRKGYINHQEQTIGYVTDLRVGNSRKAVIQWAQKFMPVLRKEMVKNECKYIFSILELFESQAFNALLRRRNRSNHLPRYHLFRRFNLIAIMGLRFLAQKSY